MSYSDFDLICAVRKFNPGVPLHDIATDIETWISAAAIQAFRQRAEGREAEIIREALKDWDDRGDFPYAGDQPAGGPA